MIRLTAWCVMIVMVAMACSKEVMYTKKRNTVETYPMLNDSTLLLTERSTDPEFGLTSGKPIRVGVVNIEKGAENVRKYLNALVGPDNQEITSTRLKPCCPFKTKNFRYNAPLLNKEFDEKYGMLEVYQISYKFEQDSTATYTLYFNLYDQDNDLRSPTALGYKKH